MMKKFFIVLSCIGFFACSKPIPTTLVATNDTIVVKGDTSKSAYLHYCIEDVQCDSVFIRLDTTFSINDILYADYKLAYQMAMQNGNLNIRLFIPNEFDTTIVIHKDYETTTHYKTTATGLNYAKLVQNTDFATNAPIVRRWLYQQNIKNVPDSTIKKIIEYNEVLKQIENVRYEYVTFQCVLTPQDKTPIISTSEQKPLPKLNVQSDMQADHYYLFLARDDSELNYLIEWQCTNNFDKGTGKLPSKLNSYRAGLSSGTYCIFLVGINDDWNTQICPIGLVCIDNEGPQNYSTPLLSNIGNDPEGYALIFFKQGLKILIPYDKSAKFTGGATIAWGSFEGHTPFFRIPYTFTWWGDVRFIRIFNNKTSDWAMLENFPKIIIIDTHKYSSPYKVTFETFLPNTGDNYLPLELEDERGNISTYTINI